MSIVGSSLTEKIISVAIPRPLPGLFTYRLPEKWVDSVRVGGWVKVPFGRAVTHAFVVEPPKTLSELSPHLSVDSLKDVLEVSEPDAVLSEDVLALCRWAHEYYFIPLGESLNCAAPAAGLKIKGTTKKKEKKSPVIQLVKRHELTPEQKTVFQFLESYREKRKSQVALLKGVTGSGKTEIYIELALKALEAGDGVLILVPEIALTPQLHQRFEKALGVPVALWHSAVSPGRRQSQSESLRKGEIRAVVGARSSVFAPIQKLGLIVVDEEHDPSYKQEERTRYHARDLAIVRSKLTHSLVVLGSATPSLESLERVREGKYILAELHHRIAPGGLPPVELIDLRNEEKVNDAQAPLALKTIRKIQETLAAGEQVIVYLNRRGFAAFLLCKDCGEVRGCPQCSISLTVHRRNGELRCHLCGYSERIPDFCPHCQGSELQAMGAGTESLETDLPKLLPDARILRLDRDQVTSASRLDKILEDFRSQKANLLLGTQMLVKGHDFPGVTLVVVILADALFRWPDFRAAERAIQILKQVAGRAGRGQKPGKVLVQTFDVEHSVLKVLCGEIPEDDFIDSERQVRQALGYPPFGRLARLRFERTDQKEATHHADEVTHFLRSMWNISTDSPMIDFLGPSEAFVGKINGIYRRDLLIKAKNIQSLQKAVIQAQDFCAKHKLQVLVDIDPYTI